MGLVVRRFDVLPTGWNGDETDLASAGAQVMDAVRMLFGAQ